MGTCSSTLNDLQSNEHLRRFCGKESISHNDPFWNQLLSFTFSTPKTCVDDRILEESTRSLLESLLVNNQHSGNFTSLLQVFLLRAIELKASAECDDNIFMWQTYNALFIVRCAIKYFIETVTEENVLRQFCNVQGKDHSDGSEMLNELINALVEIIVDVPIRDFTYGIHVESVNTLLVLLSAQMFSSRPASKSVIYRLIMQGKCSIHSLLLTKKLLQHYIKQEKYPNPLRGEGSIILGLATGLWNVLTLGYGKGTLPDAEDSSDTVLANQSLLLLLVLVNHCTSDKGLANPYRQALFSCTDSEESVTEQGDAPSFRLNFAELYNTLCTKLKDDQTTLLLYFLLHRNPLFKTFILHHANIETLVVPLLKILYQASEKSSHHIYMALIILLILSEDENFSKSVHIKMLRNITWYTDRTVSEISLGSLLVLIVIRTIQFNMTRMRDKYLHTNCLAALANMSDNFTGLHPYVCQRFVSLFENLAKRMTRTVNQLRSSNDKVDSEDDFSSDLIQDLSILEEVLRMVLEILNSCLTAKLAANPDLIYTLLYKRHVFETFQTHPAFQDIIQNIEMVLTYFSSRLEAAEGNLSVDEVYEIIKQAATQWPEDSLKKFPELKFQYIEEEQPEEFFIPYVWSLVYHASEIYWGSQNIVLFNPHHLYARTK